MASREQVDSLRYFTWEEFKHPEMMSATFLYFLDNVRREYGFPIRLTSDGRTSDENSALPGSSETSRHLVGEAVDIEFPPSANHLWLLLAAIVKCQTTRAIELIVYSDSRHVHLAFLKVGQASKFIVKAA